jgi:hypothetical protein
LHVGRRLLFLVHELGVHVQRPSPLHEIVGEVVREVLDLLREVPRRGTRKVFRGRFPQVPAHPGVHQRVASIRDAVAAARAGPSTGPCGGDPRRPSNNVNHGRLVLQVLLLLLARELRRDDRLVDRTRSAFLLLLLHVVPSRLPTSERQCVHNGGLAQQQPKSRPQHDGGRGQRPPCGEQRREPWRRVNSNDNQEE